VQVQSQAALDVFAKQRDGHSEDYSVANVAGLRKKAVLPIATEEFLHSSAFIFEKSQRFIDRLFASRQNGDQLDTVFVRQQIWNVRLSGENAGTNERHPDTRVGHSGTRMDSLRRSL
jgi:hypothetical protein